MTGMLLTVSIEEKLREAMHHVIKWYRLLLLLLASPTADTAKLQPTACLAAKKAWHQLMYVLLLHGLPRHSQVAVAPSQSCV